MKYALIGCGRIARNHIKAAIGNQLEIAAICDMELQKMKQLLCEYELQNNEIIQCYVDYKQMLEKINPELVSIATESGVHAEIALYCIKRGIHVIIEKPMAMSIQDANEIIRCAEQNNVKVSVCHQNRFNLAVQEMRKALESGRFGKLSHGSVHIRWNRNHNYYNQASWRGTWEKDGGALMNQCIHGIDLLRWTFGEEIDEVYGVIRQQLHDYLETEDVGMAAIKFKNGVVATVEGTTNVYSENLEETLYVFGEKGTVKLGGKSVNCIDIWNFEDNNIDDKNRKLQEQIENVYGNGHTSLFADMIDAIQRDRKPYVDEYAGRDAVELVLAIYKSQKEGRPVKLPLMNFSTIDMKDSDIEK